MTGNEKKMEINTREIGKLLIISGFSGVGKGTVVKKLIETTQNIWLSKSDTDRKPRNNLDCYYFITTDKFMDRLSSGDYIEYYKYGSHYYGSLRKPIIEKLLDKQIVILEINNFGMRQICQDNELKSLGVEIISTFLVEDVSTIISRLRGRGSSEIEIIERIKIASEEAACLREYDYVMYNHDIKETAVKIQSILSGDLIAGEEFDTEVFRRDASKYLQTVMV